MNIQDLKDLSPFLAIVVSMLALTVGPYVSGRIAREQAIVSMREKWIYAFRDCLVELITEFDVLHESSPDHGFISTDDYEAINKRLRTLSNRIFLMVNSDEPRYKELLDAIEKVIVMLLHGITDYDKFHSMNDEVKQKAQEAIRCE